MNIFAISLFIGIYLKIVKQFLIGLKDMVLHLGLQRDYVFYMRNVKVVLLFIGT